MLFPRQEIERPTEAILTPVPQHPIWLRPCRIADLWYHFAQLLFGQQQYVVLN
jgi:hypothetical protein